MDDFLCVLKALADETRFTIVKLLLVHDFCVRALAKRLSISEAAVSQHLKILRKAGVVRGEKRGYFTHYKVENEALENTIEVLKEMIETNNDFKSKCEKQLSQKAQFNTEKATHE
ncbi:MAG: ArsR/SmtB family transcription factor [Thermotogota bacterium]